MCLSLQDRDFEQHNKLVKDLWRDFQSNRHERIPVQWGMNDRMIVLNKELNRGNYTYQQIFNDPEVMLRVQLDFEYWRRHEVFADWEMGLPEEWSVAVNFQNVYESAWFGAPLFFTDGSVPDIKPFLKRVEDVKAFIEKGGPEPFTSFDARIRKFYEYFLEKKEGGYTYLGRPLGNISAPIGTDGPFTVAVNITGGYIVKLLYRERSLAEKLLWLITEAIIERMKAWHKLLKEPFPREGFGFADDSIQLLSPSVYKEFVLPLHKKIVDTFCVGRPSIHLCGRVMHLLSVLKEELKISAIDTGFPLDLGKAREILGTDVTIYGGVRVATLLNGPLNRIEEEVRSVLNSGVTKGKRFVFRDANNVAPCTPAEHLNYAYELVKNLGRYEEDAR
ncbi:MAG: uroporphyrinogen decarboxylase family protein [Thermofilaceae archaeon]|nr:uroporphyrinogen decarboxylase family protein [Thermofilaceae archaeon]MCX8180985.1 uroporphyrinogen decarboxylase family protein [Thermofilaceae archaeon]MDW8004090.1 uroporphyrinogen decarboxylase family protein [Thermofilaceae archaeon]